MDSRATEILTEHLGFPPIALIDDIINAVNGVMYKCTQGVETYLKQKQELEIANVGETDDDIILDNVGVIDKGEIEVGTGKLETLLENAVDKNFDKFELYALRNILTIPGDCIGNGNFKLRHYEGVHFSKDAEVKSVKLDIEITELFKEIELQIYLKKSLTKQLKKAKKLIQQLKTYKESLSFLSLKQTSIESIEQLNETFYHVITQTIELFKQCQDITGIFDTQTLSNDKDREKYLNLETLKLLTILGLTQDKPKISKILTNLNNVDLSNPELKQALQQTFNITYE
jgi:kinetochore protein Mis12/MTW1